MLKKSIKEIKVSNGGAQCKFDFFVSNFIVSVSRLRCLHHGQVQLVQSGLGHFYSSCLPYFLDLLWLQPIYLSIAHVHRNRKQLSKLNIYYIELVHVYFVLFVAHEHFSFFPLILFISLSPEVLWVLPLTIRALFFFKNVTNHTIAMLLWVYSPFLHGLSLMVCDLLLEGVHHIVGSNVLLLLLSINLLVLCSSLFYCSLIHHNMIEFFLPGPPLELESFIVIIDMRILPF